MHPTATTTDITIPLNGILADDRGRFDCNLLQTWTGVTVLETGSAWQNKTEANDNISTDLLPG